MKKMYVPKTLNEFLNESKSITLKRKYGERQPIVVGTNAPLRNQVLSFVAENASVSKRDLKQYIIGLKEGGATVASANMFIKRNSKYFITENKNGITYFKLSPIGQRLVNQFVPTNDLNVSESFNLNELEDDANNIMSKSLNGRRIDGEDLEDEDLEDEDLEDDVEANDYDENEGPADEVEFNDDRFSDENEDENLEDEDHVEDDQFEYEEDDEKIVLTYYKNKDEDLEDEDLEDEDEDLEDEDLEDEDEDLEDEDLEDEDLEDEDLEDEDLEDEDLEDELDENDDRPENEKTREYDFKDKGRPGLNDMDESLEESVKERMRNIIENIKNNRNENLNEAEETEADEKDELSDEDLEKLGGKDEEKPEGEEETPENEDDNVEKVEITEFIITVDDVDEAIDELAELGVTAERVPVEPKEEEVLAPEEEPVEEPIEEKPEGEEEKSDNLDLDTEEKPEEKVKESLDEAEEEKADDDLDLGASDDLSLGDQGENAPELEDKPEGEEETIEPTAEFEENKIKVPADSWPTLKTWLEEKGVDVKEMFGGDIEMEEVSPEEDTEVTEEPSEEVDDSEIDFSGIGEEDDTKIKKE